MSKFGQLRRSSLNITDSLPDEYLNNTYVQQVDALMQSNYLSDGDGLFTISLDLEYVMVFNSKSIINNPKNYLIGYFFHHDIHIESISYQYNVNFDPILEFHINLNKPFVLDYSLF